jgi:hypothetical protein
MNLQKLCENRREKTRSLDLSLQRVMNSSSEFSSSSDNAIVVALQGVSIFTTPNFVPCNIPPPIRQIYLTVDSAVNKTIYKMYLNGLVLLLPTKVVRAIPGVHFSPICIGRRKRIRLLEESLVMFQMILLIMH